MFYKLVAHVSTTYSVHQKLLTILVTNHVNQALQTLCTFNF